MHIRITFLVKVENSVSFCKWKCTARVDSDVIEYGEPLHRSSTLHIWKGWNVHLDIMCKVYCASNRAGRRSWRSYEPWLRNNHKKHDQCSDHLESKPECLQYGVVRALLGMIRAMLGAQHTFGAAYKACSATPRFARNGNAWNMFTSTPMATYVTSI